MLPSATTLFTLDVFHFIFFFSTSQEEISSPDTPKFVCGQTLSPDPIFSHTCPDHSRGVYQNFRLAGNRFPGVIALTQFWYTQFFDIFSPPFDHYHFDFASPSNQLQIREKSFLHIRFFFRGGYLYKILVGDGCPEHPESFPLGTFLLHKCPSLAALMMMINPFYRFVVAAAPFKTITIITFAAIGCWCQFHFGDAFTRGTSFSRPNNSGPHRSSLRPFELRCFSEVFSPSLTLGWKK